MLHNQQGDGHKFNIQEKAGLFGAVLNLTLKLIDACLFVFVSAKTRFLCQVLGQRSVERVEGEWLCGGCHAWEHGSGIVELSVKPEKNDHLTQHFTPQTKNNPSVIFHPSDVEDHLFLSLMIAKI